MNKKILDSIQLLKTAGFSYTVVPAQQKDSHVVKTIVFKKKSDDTPIAVALPLEHRVCYKKLRELVAGPVSALSPDELAQLGWLPGECCPLTINCALFVDESVLKSSEIHTGSGDILFGLRYSVDALQQLRPDIHIVSLCKE